MFRHKKSCYTHQWVPNITLVGVIFDLLVTKATR